MVKFRLTQKVKSDLLSIARHTANEWGVEQRNLYLRDIDRQFHALAENPLLGKECSEIRNGYRKFPQGKHIIYYASLSQNEILLVRILHRNMDMASKF